MELENAQYEHSIEEQSNSLNQELENYENERNAEIEKLKESLTEKEGLIAASFEAVKQNAALIGQEIANIATEHGITVSNAVITPGRPARWLSPATAQSFPRAPAHLSKAC